MPAIIHLTFIYIFFNLSATRPLESHLIRQVEAILDTSQLLHQSLIKEDSTQVRLHLSHIERLISLANQASYRNTNMLHLRHVLHNTQRAVEQASLHGRESLVRQNIKSMFDQLVLLSQTYKLNSRYPIYFCKKDKSVWLQRAGKIRNLFIHITLCVDIW